MVSVYGDVYVEVVREDTNVSVDRHNEADGVVSAALQLVLVCPVDIGRLRGGVVGPWVIVTVGEQSVVRLL
jgi:hypothetical protein